MRATLTRRHGHTDVCNVTVGGEIDALTGCGAPTTENIAAWIARVVQRGLESAASAPPAHSTTHNTTHNTTPTSARVERVRVAEEPGLWAEVVLSSSPG